MEFHPHKCQVLTITNKTKPLKTSYNFHNVTLEKIDSARYLWVEIHKKLKLKQHVASTCKKANQTINFLQRNLRGCTKSLKAKAYNIYVKPKKKFESPIWKLTSPVNNYSLMRQIEQVQRKAGRFVTSDFKRFYIDVT